MQNCKHTAIIYFLLFFLCSRFDSVGPRSLTTFLFYSISGLPNNNTEMNEKNNSFLFTTINQIDTIKNSERKRKCNVINGATAAAAADAAAAGASQRRTYNLQCAVTEKCVCLVCVSEQMCV